MKASLVTFFAFFCLVTLLAAPALGKKERTRTKEETPKEQPKETDDLPARPVPPQKSALQEESVQESIKHNGGADELVQGKVFWIYGATGQPIMVREFPSRSGFPLGVIYHSTDYRDHSGHMSYLQYFRRLARAGFHVFSYDHIGLGQSATPVNLGIITSLREYSQELLSIMKHVEREGDKWGPLRDVPIFLTGNGYGADVSIQAAFTMANWTKPVTAAIKSRFKGAALFAPAIHEQPEETPEEKQLRNAFLRDKTRFDYLGPALDRDFFSGEEGFQHYKADPLNFVTSMPRISAVALQDIARDMATQVARIDFPFIAFQGTKDVIFRGDLGVKPLVEKSQTPPTHKKLMMIQGANHALFLEPSWEEMTVETIRFFSALVMGRVPNPPSEPAKGDL